LSARHREELEYKIPKEHRTPLAFLEGYRVDARFENLVLTMAKEWSAPGSICSPCWRGIFCEEWKRTAQGKLDASRILHPEWWKPVASDPDPNTPLCWHLLCVFSPGEEHRWLLRQKGMPEWTRSVLRLRAPFDHYDDEDILAWSIDTAVIGGIRKSFEQKKRDIPWCAQCLQGHACEAWDVKLLRVNGYRPRAPNRRRKTPVWKDFQKENAAKSLGLEWPTTEEKIKTAFAKEALKAHPDHGGTEEKMKNLLRVRELLLKQEHGRRTAP